MEHQGTGQPVAQFDIEIEFSRAQGKVFLDRPVEVAGPRRHSFNHALSERKLLIYGPGLRKRVPENLACRVLLRRPADLELSYTLAKRPLSSGSDNSGSGRATGGDLQLLALARLWPQLRQALDVGAPKRVRYAAPSTRPPGH